MTNREAALNAIGVDDIFNAEEASGATRICVTIAVTDDAIMARAVTTQEILEFGRKTGTEINCRYGGSHAFVISSVASLPPDIHEIMLSLDRKYREGEYRLAEDPTWEPSREESVLTKEQIRGLLFVADFYRAHPI